MQSSIATAVASTLNYIERELQSSAAAASTSDDCIETKLRSSSANHVEIATHSNRIMVESLQDITKLLQIKLPAKNIKIGRPKGAGNTVFGKQKFKLSKRKTN